MESEFRDLLAGIFAICDCFRYTLRNFEWFWNPILTENVWHMIKCSVDTKRYISSVIKVCNIVSTNRLYGMIYSTGFK